MVYECVMYGILCMYIVSYMWCIMWYIMYIILYIMMYIIVSICMIVWWCCVGVLCYVNMILYCVCGSVWWMWSYLLLCASCLVMSRWFYDGFMPDFIVIDVIYYFFIAYNVWLYIYVFRRILLFLYVVECWFSLVFIDFMPFIVLWSYFLFMQNFTIVHGRMYRRTENTP